MINKQFREELIILINRYSIENGSDTPDFILADYLISCLHNFDVTVSRREGWHERPGDDDEVCKSPEGHKK